MTDAIQQAAVESPRAESPRADLRALADAVETGALELAVVIPTYNEKANIAAIVERVERVLAGTCHEIIFVDDDSPDGTSEAVRSIALHRHNVRLIRRIGRRGLSSACLEGMMSTAAPYVAVMDGDLQHDESILPRMLTQARDGQLDLVIASRHVEGASMGEFAAQRVRLSNLGLALSRAVLHVTVSDPMSGFFSPTGDSSTIPSTAPPESASSCWWICWLRLKDRSNLRRFPTPSGCAKRAKASWISWSASNISTWCWTS